MAAVALGYRAKARVGASERRDRGRGGVAALSSPRHRRGGFGGDTPCSDPGRGNRGRRRGRGRRARGGQLGQVGRLAAWRAEAQGAGEAFSFFFVFL